MAEQAALFEGPPVMEETMTDGSPLTIWQKAVIAEWHRRHPEPIVWSSRLGEIALVPRGVYCARCSAAAVMFPGDSLTFPDNKGYCICPACSVSKKAADQ